MSIHVLQRGDLYKASVMKAVYIMVVSIRRCLTVASIKVHKAVEQNNLLLCMDKVRSLCMDLQFPHGLTDHHPMLLTFAFLFQQRT